MSQYVSLLERVPVKVRGERSRRAQRLPWHKRHRSRKPLLRRRVRSLGEALTLLGIYPINRVGVAAYKEATLQDANRHLRLVARVERALISVVTTVAILTFVAFVIAIGGLIAAIFHFLSWSVGIVSLLTAVGLGLLGRFLLFGVKFPAWAAWRTVSGADLQGVPLFGREMAASIRRWVPGCTFEVEKLERGKRTLDPFLVVRWKGERHYILVWDEKGFMF